MRFNIKLRNSLSLYNIHKTFSFEFLCHFLTYSRFKWSRHLTGQKSNSDTLAGGQATKSNLVHQHLQASKLLGGRGGGGVFVCLFGWMDGGGGLDEVCALGHMQQRWQWRHSAITHDNLSTCHALTSRQSGWTGRAGLCLMCGCVDM